LTPDQVAGTPDQAASCTDEFSNTLYLWCKHTLLLETNEVLEITKISLVPIPLYKVKHWVADMGSVFIISFGFVPFKEILVFMAQSEFS